MNNLAEYLTCCLLKHHIIEKKTREDYVYGFQLLVGKISNYGTLLFLAILNRLVIPTILFMIVFFGLRGTTGGYHAKTPTCCYLMTVISYLLIMHVIAPVVGSNIIFSIIMVIFASIVIFIFAPVNHPNLDLNEIEIRMCQHSSRCRVFLLVSCVGIAYMLSIGISYVTYVILGLALDAVSICIAKLICVGGIYMRKKLQATCVAAGMAILFAGCASQDAPTEQEVVNEPNNIEGTSATDAGGTTEGDTKTSVTISSVLQNIPKFSGELDFDYVYETDAQAEIGIHATCAYTKDGRYYMKAMENSGANILYFYDNDTGVKSPL